MAKSYFIEHASGDSEWTPEARDMLARASAVVRAFLEKEEAGGPVVLREFDFIFKEAVTNIVSDESVRRRCLPDGEKSFTPDPDFDAMVEAADGFIADHPNALKELGEVSLRHSRPAKL